jgi:hypothetical protein
MLNSVIDVIINSHGTDQQQPQQQQQQQQAR